MRYRSIRVGEALHIATLNCSHFGMPMLIDRVADCRWFGPVPPRVSDNQPVHPTSQHSICISWHVALVCRTRRNHRSTHMIAAFTEVLHLHLNSEQMKRVRARFRCIHTTLIQRSIVLDRRRGAVEGTFLRTAGIATKAGDKVPML